jgi:glycosyltransferase involved in cell wall biosynthesis
MRCLFLVATFPGMGTYLRAEAMAKLFDARGHDVEIWCASGLRQYRATNLGRVAGRDLKRVEFPRWMPFGVVDPVDGWNPLDVANRLGRALAGPKRDLVFAFEHKPAAFWPARIAKLFRGATLILDRSDVWGGHEGLFEGHVMAHPSFAAMPAWMRAARRTQFALEARAERRAPRKADAATVISETLREEVAELGMSRDRIELLYTPASLDTLPMIDKAVARRELNLPADAPIVGLVASYVHEEPLLWPLWRAMLDAMPDLVLLLAGPGFQQAPPWALEGPLAARVWLPGRVPFERVPLWMAASDILWCPQVNLRYNRARFAQKFFDYIAAGRPVFATDVGDIGPLVREHDMGGATETLEELASATLEALRAPAERRAEWGANARSAAERVFSPAAATKLLEPFLRRVLPAGREF